MKVGEDEEEKKEKKKESNTEQRIKQIYMTNQTKKERKEGGGGPSVKHELCSILSNFLGSPGRRSRTHRNTRHYEGLETTLPGRNRLWGRPTGDSTEHPSHIPLFTAVSSPNPHYTSTCCPHADESLGASSERNDLSGGSPDYPPLRRSEHSG